MSYIQNKLSKLWLKLLKASVKGKYKKATKLEQKIIELELELRDVK